MISKVKQRKTERLIERDSVQAVIK